MKSLVQFINESLITESVQSELIAKMFKDIKDKNQHSEFYDLLHRYQWDKIKDDDIETVNQDYFADKDNIENVINKINKEQVIVCSVFGTKFAKFNIITPDRYYYKNDYEVYSKPIDRLNAINLMKNIAIGGGNYNTRIDSPIYIINITGLITDDIHDEREEAKKGILTALSMQREFNKKLRALKDKKRSLRSASAKPEVTEEQIREFIQQYAEHVKEFDKVKDNNKDQDVMTEMIHYFLEFKEFNAKMSSMSKEEAFNKFKEFDERLVELTKKLK